MTHGKACGTCVAWERMIPQRQVMDTAGQVEVSLGNCRMRAPSAVGWPITRENDWCYDYRRQNGSETTAKPSRKNGGGR